MSWQVDVSVWADEPDSIQVFSDDGREQDYVPERTCKPMAYQEPGSRLNHEPLEYWEYWGAFAACSACGEFVPFMNYCPNCGAKVVSDD